MKAKVISMEEYNDAQSMKYLGPTSIFCPDCGLQIEGKESYVKAHFKAHADAERGTK